MSFIKDNPKIIKMKYLRITGKILCVFIGSIKGEIKKYKIPIIIKGENNCSFLFIK